MELRGQFHAPAALSPGKDSRYAVNKRLVGPRRGVVEKI
jgi:hypothetical protein